MIFKTDESGTILQKCIFDKEEKNPQIDVSVVIPEGITEIKSYTFWGQGNIVSVSLPSTLKHINQGAFEKCSRLKSVIIPEGTETIANSVFRDCFNLETAILPQSLTLIGEYAFSHCHLYEIDIPKSVKMMGFAAFHDTRTTFHLEGDKNFTVCLEGSWNAPPQWNGTQNLHLYNFISNPSVNNFKSMDRFSYKIPIAIAYSDTDKYYSDYIKKFRNRVVDYCIDADDLDALIKVLDMRIIGNEILNTVIDHAVEKERNEMSVLLMQYKRMINGYEKPFDFEL